MLMEVDFDERLKNLRIELYEFYHKHYVVLANAEKKSKTAPDRILEQLLDQRNAASPAADLSYFDTETLSQADVAAYVLEGALSEIDWLENVDKPEDIEARLHWICEQETATAELPRNDRVEKKICGLKGKFLVIWTALLRLGIYRPGGASPDAQAFD